MNGNIFWNGTEGRLRAFWRILLQSVIFLSAMLLTGMLIGVAIAAIIAATGADTTDPQVIAGIGGHPPSRAGEGLSALLAMFISYWAAARWLDRRSLPGFGFHLNRGWWVDFAFGLFLGAFLMLLIFLVERAMGWVTIIGTMQSAYPGTTFLFAISMMAVRYICVGIYEEMLSRGYHLRNLAEGLKLGSLSPKAALLLAYLISSSIFGLLHFFNDNATWVSTANIIIAGLFLGLGFVLTGELAIPIGLHITWNFFQGNVFGFPVSGGASSASFIAIQQGGPELWTGGAFGPEAGLIGLLAIALGGLLTVLWVRYRRGKVRLQDSLAVYTFGGHAPSAEGPVSAIQNGG